MNESLKTISASVCSIYCSLCIEVMVCWFPYLHLRKKALQLHVSLKFIFSLPSLFLILKVYISNFLLLVICFYLLKGPITRGGCWRSHFPTVFFLLYFGYFPALSTEERKGRGETARVSLPSQLESTETEFMNVQSRWGSGHNLESSQA